MAAAAAAAAAAAGAAEEPQQGDGKLPALLKLLKDASSEDSDIPVPRVIKAVGELMYEVKGAGKKALTKAVKQYLVRVSPKLEVAGALVGVHQVVMLMAQELDIPLSAAMTNPPVKAKAVEKLPAKETLVSKGKSFDILAKRSVFNMSAAEAMETLTTGDDKLPYETAHKVVALDWTKDRQKAGSSQQGIVAELCGLLDNSEVSNDRQLLVAWRQFCVCFSKLLDSTDSDAWDKLTAELANHFIIPLLGQGFQAGEVTQELEDWFLRVTKTAMLAHVAGKANPDAELALIAEAADMSVEMDQPFWPTLHDKLTVRAHAKQVLRKRRDQIANGTYSPMKEVRSPSKGPCDAAEAILGEFALPNGWKQKMVAASACPLNTLIPGLCSRGHRCPIGHAADAATLTKHRKKLAEIIGVEHLVRVRLLFDEAIKASANIQDDFGGRAAGGAAPRGR